jgi:CBS domain-containing protein
MGTGAHPRDPRVTYGAPSLDDVQVKDAMHAGVVSCALEAPLTEAARLVAEHRIHCVVGFGDVTADDTQVWGVISDLDIVGAAAAGDIAGLPASSAAGTEVLTIAPDRSLREAARIMAEHAVSHVLVVEPGSDRPVGVLSTLDLAAVLGGHLSPETTAAP